MSDIYLYPDLESVDNVLAHYGVKGMKWGVYRDRAVSIAKDPRTKAAAKVAGRVAAKTAVSTGLGLVGLAGVKEILSDQEVSRAIGKGAETARSILSEYGGIPIPKVNNPFNDYRKLVPDGPQYRPTYWGNNPPRSKSITVK